MKKFIIAIVIIAAVAFIIYESSFEGKFALISIGRNSEALFSVFDFSKNSWQPLPEKTISAAWSPNKSSIAYLSDLGNISTINILDLDTKKNIEIFKFNQKELLVRSEEH